MNTHPNRGHLSYLLLACLLMGCAGAYDDEPPPQVPPPPPPAPSVEVAPTPEPYTDATQPPTSPPSAPPAAAPPPPSSQAPAGPPVQSYPTGQWVYLAGQGWVWVPAGAATTDAEGVPYTYLYTPAYGWTWYVSPWGWGPYRYGPWVRHPWHPVGMHGYWVAHPHVTVHLGHGGFGHGGRGRR